MLPDQELIFLSSLTSNMRSSCRGELLRISPWLNSWLAWLLEAVRPHCDKTTSCPHLGWKQVETPWSSFEVMMLSNVDDTNLLKNFIFKIFWQVCYILSTSVKKDPPKILLLAQFTSTKCPEEITALGGDSCWNSNCCLKFSFFTRIIYIFMQKFNFHNLKYFKDIYKQRRRAIKVRQQKLTGHCLLRTTPWFAPVCLCDFNNLFELS
jgi:hypothetical protein